MLGFTFKKRDFNECQLINTDLEITILALKEQEGKDRVIWGSLSLAQSQLTMD
ncbi:MAG: hypothetical protein ABIO93_17925 [Dyadobacter sp.]|uniref:hypothetical protein n=1 Tax=Dyadobacter sp. TaxID=1914288 RepID=UPI003262FD08